MVLAELGKAAEVENELRAGAYQTVNARKKDGKTCLHVAAAAPSSPAQQSILQSLIAARADLNAVDASNLTPLAVSASVETSDLLKKQGAEGWTELMLAAEKGSVDYVKAVIVSRADLNARQPSQKTALHIAAEGGSQECVAYLVSARADVNAVYKAKDPYYGTESLKSVLDAARDDRVVRVLREAGADGWTELMVAADDRDAARLKKLVEQGAKPNAQARDGSTALHIAVRNAASDRDAGRAAAAGSGANQGLKSLQTAKALLESRADPNLKDRSGNSAYDLRSNFTPEMDALFRSWGADGWTPLMLASEKGDAAGLAALLAQRADPNARNVRGYAALHHASSVAVATALLEAKAIIDLEAKESSGEVPVDTVPSEDVKDALRVRGGGGWTRLMIESRKANLGAVQELLRSRADVNAVDRQLESALFKAATLKYELRVKETVETLIHSKANLEARNKDKKTALEIAQDENVRDVLRFLGAGGWTPLMVAARRGDVREVGGARSDPDAFNGERMTALHIAVSQSTEYPDVVRALLAARASPATRASSSRTALHLAVEQGFAESAKLLVDGRADLEARDAAGQTPLFAAVRYERLQVVRVLVDAGANVEATDGDGRTPERSAYGIPDDIRAVLRGKRTQKWNQLMVAAEAGDEEQVGRLLQSKADVNSKSLDSRSALHVASLSSKGVVSLLVGSRADVSAPSSFGTPLQIALGRKRSVAWWESVSDEALDALKQAGADGWTAVMIAAEKGDVSALQTLLLQKHSATAASTDGTTALHAAAGYAADMDASTFEKVVVLLLNARAALDAPDRSNRSPLDVALEGVARYNYGSERKADVLRRAGANGWTPLMCAALAGDDGAVQNLINDGVDLFARNKVRAFADSLLAREHPNPGFSRKFPLLLLYLPSSVA